MVKNSLSTLIDSVGEEIEVDKKVVKALVRFGVNDRGMDVKIVKFISFKDSYEKVKLRDVEYGVIGKFIDEFGVCSLELGELNE